LSAAEPAAVRRAAGPVPALLAAALLALPATPAAAQAPAPPEVRAGRAAAMRLDGVPDEAAWLTADSITDFRQREPGEGAPPSERTVVRVLAAPEGLWVAFWCYDRTPGRIVHAQLRRDADLDGDDWVGVVLDPQRDRRTGFAFQVNANGAMGDAEVQGQHDLNGEWDGVWDARARIGRDGWTAELVIPWQTFRYRRDGGGWGLNVARFIRRDREEILWRGWRRPQGPYFLEEEGVLTGLGPLPGRDLTEWRPYASATASDYQRDYHPDGTYDLSGEREVTAKVGLDGKLAVAPTLTLDLTANTDFAQVEADQQMVNLSRFPLFFPEKRPFFLEASGNFSFGQSQEAMAFYSRRIGLGADRTAVPIVTGARLSGRMSAERLGLLVARTGGSEDAVDVVARLKHDVFTRGYVGGILTGQGGPGVAGTRLTGGLDYDLPFIVGGENLGFAGYVMGTRSGGGAPTRTAGRFYVDYPNDWSDSFLGISWVEAGFDPALGFVRQDGVWRHTGGFQFTTRPDFPGVRKVEFKLLEWEVSHYIGGGLNFATYEVSPLGIEFNTGEQVSIELQREIDVPQVAFDIWEKETAAGTQRITIPAGRHDWDRAGVHFESSYGRPVSVNAEASVGGFYTGTSTTVDAGVDVRLAPHVIAGWNTEVGWVRLPQGRFTAQTMQFRFDYTFTPRLGTMCWLQWDSESERLSLNARVHWIPKPGSDAYLVWDSGWPTGLEHGGIPWRRPTRGALVGKFVYYFRA
jgi:hypothetical protein